MNRIAAAVRLIGYRVHWQCDALPWFLPGRHAVFEHPNNRIIDLLPVVPLLAVRGFALHLRTGRIHCSSSRSPSTDPKSPSSSKAGVSVSNPEPSSGSPPIWSNNVRFSLSMCLLRLGHRAPNL